MTDTPLRPDEIDDLLAAEYVLGVQDLITRNACADRLRKEPAFAARVADWENRLAALNADYTETPAPDFLPAIEARLFPKGARSRPGLPGGVLRWLSGAVLATALVLGGLVLLPPQEPALLAVLGNSEERLAYEVRHGGDSLQVTRTVGGPAGMGMVHELWIIAPDAAPVSLGLLEAETLVVTYPAPPAGWTLAVSIEPVGGSKTGLPSGPVILTAVVGGET